ncbi:hypothetical protein SEA_TURBOVICKY_6 [Microbacterium phage TurboVicky]|nr:hypothetical protein SEA_TYPHER_6 [Microbacterium phage Typher]UVK60337.1 hypothetical protein SEA_TURBOVICKY_6 [Microbacterium phage TurboVicky]
MDVITIEEQGLIDQFREFFTNTGGNEPETLIRKYRTDNNLITTNIVVFTLAQDVEGQLRMLGRLRAAGRI